MARRSGRFKARKRHEPRRYTGSTERTSMLNLYRITPFKYDMKEIMSAYRVDEAVASSVIASVVAKASRISITSARDYVRVQQKEGLYSKDVSDEICDLLSRYTKYR
ncbi:MAG: hypothetical protein OEM29_05495 [Thermoplasmata archaeon]|nr:hypothetical protein [Thermoplasmata archaeon]